MAKVKALRCLRCGAHYAPSHYDVDCDACRPVAPSNLTVVYDDAMRRTRQRPTPGRSIWRFGDVLPVPENDAVSLSEGGSPLHRLEGTAASLGMNALFAKDETRNPTWSFKDRLACMAVSAAKSMNARQIVSSSSGNAGAAAAAYAAKAQLPCVIFTFKGAAGPMLTQMRSYGARVVMVENKGDRWTLMQHAVRSFGWFPTSPFFGPVVGSNPYGIEGYKTLAYEIAEQMNWQVPDWCVLPICYGDALVGMWKGFEDMMAFGWTDRMPRMIGAEIHGSAGKALNAGDDAPPDMPKLRDTIAVSIGATQSTYQAVDILRQSRGVAVKVEDDALMRWQRTLAEKDGLYVEPSSAAALAALESLRNNSVIGPNDQVVVLLTASGLKDPAATERFLPETTTVPANIAAAVDVLKSEGIFPK